MKFGVSVIGPFIVTLALLPKPVKDPEPVPLQLMKPNPAFGVAEIPIICPLLKKLLFGPPVPPLPAFIVKKYWVVKFAV